MPRHFPPLLHATAAAHRRSVHRLEDGMPAHGRLPTILLRLGRRELHTDKILGVSPDRLQTHASNVRAICRGQLEPRTELRPPEPHKRAGKKPVILCSGAKIIQRESTAQLTPASHLILSALEFIQKNATRNIRVDDIVRHLKVSRRLADLRFREFQGESILETITRIRLEEVAKRLLTTQIPASTIAKTCGFEDVSYLGKLFRRKYGETLQRWRKFHLPDDRPR